MAIELQTFESGDTDYIAKMNANVAALTTAIESLQLQMAAGGSGGGGGNTLSAGLMIDALFNRADALIGTGSYKPTLSASTITVAPGSMYLAATQKVVSSYSTVPLSFIGQPVGTHYVVVDTSGYPVRLDTLQPGTIYSVYWSGSGLSFLTYIAPVYFDTIEASASRKSAALATDYTTLDLRLEAGEVLAKTAGEDSESALAIAYELQAAVGGRKIGITVDGTTGIKGAIQITFNGTIVGWSVIADVPGTLQVEVSRKASSAPPAAPAIPDPVTNKISASAPIALAGTQSASRTASGVATWTTALKKWDVIQFNVAAVATITRATLYLLIEEDLTEFSPPESSPLEFDDTELVWSERPSDESFVDEQIVDREGDQ